MDFPNKNIVDIVSKIFAYLCIIETGLSIILNPLVLIIILKSKRLRTTSTFQILAVSAVNDTLISLGWNIEFFVMTIYNYVPSFTYLFFCRGFVSFLAYTTLGIQSWILLSISVDRLLSMTVKKWTKFYFKGYRPCIFAVLLCLFIAGLNFHELFTVGYSFFDTDSQSEIVMCYVTNPIYSYDWYTFANLFSIFFGFVSPASILLVVNVLIILKATHYERSQKSNGNTNAANMHSERKKAQMTRMILFLTFFFIALALPDQLYFGYLYSIIDQNFYGTMMGNIMNFIQFFFASFHIFILYFSNKQFAKEVNSTIFRMKNNQVSSMTGTKSQSVLNNRVVNTIQPSN